jgi:hypothetical protein
MIANGKERLVWQKSARCDSGTCVEVAVTAAGIGMRNSGDPNGPVLWFSQAEWAAFVEGLRRGDFHR